MKKCKIMHGPAGMTLVELLTGLIILTVLTAIGMPGILGSIQRTGVDGASRRLAEDIRRAQSNALTRGVQARLVVFDKTGLLPTTPTPINDSTKANMYRIELNGPYPTCLSSGWPSLTDTPGSNCNVLTDWNDLGAQYRGVSVDSGSTVTFNSIGGTTAVSIVVQGSGGTRTIQTNAIGKATIL
jgi:prepilin-type N-terminal cleavage/methylation domain-containing protein